MGKRIYVGNLPWSITKIRLEELFSSFGEVEDALVISDKYTGRSRGFGFITFKKDGDADKAISEMNEKEVEGRTLVVKEARPLREKAKEHGGEEIKEEKPAEAEKESETEEPAEEKTEETEKPKKAGRKGGKGKAKQKAGKETSE